MTAVSNQESEGANPTDEERRLIPPNGLNASPENMRTPLHTGNQLARAGDDGSQAIPPKGWKGSSMKCAAASAKVITDESVSERLPQLRATLPPSQAVYLLLRYEGGCGRRSVREAALLTRKGKYLEVAVPPKARQDFRELCVTLLELRYPDWAAGEGAAGSFNWDLYEDRLIHSHTPRTDHPVPAGNGTAVLGDDGMPF